MSYKIRIPKLRSMLAVMACLFVAASVHAGSYKVYSPYFAWNNNFNDPNGYLNISFGSGSNPQWTAWWNVPSKNLYGYPASIRGWHYGWNPANDNLFPRKISSTTSIPCSFSYDCGGTIGGDFTYDCFFRWDSAKSTPQTEVMVWSRNN